MKTMTLAAVAACAIAATPASATQLMTANFDVVTNPGGNTRMFADPSATYTGSLIFDADSIPGSGTTNVAFASNSGLSNAQLLSFTVGSLSFNLGDNLNTERAASIQYKNGQFNGIVFLSDFQSGGVTYRFRSEGNTFSIKSGATSLVTGKINNLTNVMPYVAPVTSVVPEPVTWAMMLIGFGMMGASLRYRRRSTKAALA